VVATMKLVDTLDEQHLLERLLEESKPPVPLDCRHLHYLLATPFRYGAPSPSGSRFRRPGFTPGVFYASLAAAVAIAEMAFRRLLFFAESPATPWPANAAEYTVFAVGFRTLQGLDLGAPPLDRDSAVWGHPTNYAPCHDLADAARASGVEVLRYPSVRAAGRNVALLACSAFGSRQPLERQTWRIHVGSAGARAICDFPGQRLGFTRDAFAADARIAGLAWDRG
jgi:hypothetical protein